MKATTALSIIAVSATALGVSTGAQAQQAKKLFFEGDIVRHALADQAGPFCVLNNQYKRKEAVALRIRVIEPNGEVADDKVLKSVVVELGNGQSFRPLRPHGTPATDHFWSLFWTIPGDFPTGSLGYKVVATMNDGSTVEWEPFIRPTTQLMVVAGDRKRRNKARPEISDRPFDARERRVVLVLTKAQIISIPVHVMNRSGRLAGFAARCWPSLMSPVRSDGRLPLFART